MELNPLKLRNTKMDLLPKEILNSPYRSKYKAFKFPPNPSETAAIYSPMNLSTNNKGPWIGTTG